MAPRRINAVIVSKGTRLEPAGVEAVLLAKRQFLAHLPDVALAAGVVQALILRKVDVADVRSQFAKQAYRLRACLVGEHGIRLAVAIGQLGHGCVDFILQQRGTGSGTAPSDVALLEDDRVEVVCGQFVRDQRAGDAAANHRNVAAHRRLHLRERVHQAVLDCPKRVTTLEVHGGTPALG